METTEKLVAELEEIKLRMEAFFDPDGNPPENTGEFAELKGAIKMIEVVIRSIDDLSSRHQSNPIDPDYAEFKAWKENRGKENPKGSLVGELQDLEVKINDCFYKEISKEHNDLLYIAFQKCKNITQNVMNMQKSGLNEVWGEIYQRLLNGGCSYKELEAIRRVMDEVLSRCSFIPLAPKPEAKTEEGLREELQGILDDHLMIHNVSFSRVRDNVVIPLRKLERMLSRHPAPLEPLAVLCARKGFYSVEIQPPTKTVDSWDIEICRELEDNDGSEREKVFEAPTYEAAEKLARQYLESLNDKKEG